MLVYIIRRLMQAALVMVVMSALVFAGIYLIGDPVAMMISPDASEIDREQVRAALGLDLPMWQQYLVFVGDAVRGNFGKSFLAGQPAMGLIFERFPATLELAVVSMILSLLVGLPMGVYAGLRPNRRRQVDHDRFDPGLFAAQFLGRADADHDLRRRAARPAALVAAPAGLGPRPDRRCAGHQTLDLHLDGWRHLLLPAVTLALYKGALIVRLARATAREVLPMDYIKFARAKGLATAASSASTC